MQMFQQSSLFLQTSSSELSNCLNFLKKQTQIQNTCEVCQKSFQTLQVLQIHSKIAHGFIPQLQQQQMKNTNQQERKQLFNSNISKKVKSEVDSFELFDTNNVSNSLEENLNLNAQLEQTSSQSQSFNSYSTNDLSVPHIKNEQKMNKKHKQKALLKQNVVKQQQQIVVKNQNEFCPYYNNNYNNTNQAQVQVITSISKNNVLISNNSNNNNNNKKLSHKNKQLQQKQKQSKLEGQSAGYRIIGESNKQNFIQEQQNQINNLEQDILKYIRSDTQIVEQADNKKEKNQTLFKSFIENFSVMLNKN